MSLQSSGSEIFKTNISQLLCSPWRWGWCKGPRGLKRPTDLPRIHAGADPVCTWAGRLILLVKGSGPTPTNCLYGSSSQRALSPTLADNVSKILLEQRASWDLLIKVQPSPPSLVQVANTDTWKILGQAFKKSPPCIPALGPVMLSVKKNCITFSFIPVPGHF